MRTLLVVGSIFHPRQTLNRKTQTLNLNPVLVVGSIFLYEAIVPFDTKVNIGLALAFGLACYLAPWDKL